MISDPSQPQEADFPAYGIFSLVLAYGALLILTLAALSGRWSGVASLMMGYSFFIAPVTVGIAAVKSYKVRHTGRVHELVYQAGFWFFLLLLAFLVLVCVLPERG